MIRANLLYTQNGGHRHEEWFRVPATLTGNNSATAELPEGTTHYLFNLIDEHNFLVSHPKMMDTLTKNRNRKTSRYSKDAFAVTPQ